MTNYEKQLIDIIKQDKQIMSILEVVEKLNLNDAFVCAGLIRNKVWDTLHRITTPIQDIDVIYFDSTDTSREIEKELENKLIKLLPNQPWSVKNQARMHVKSGFKPFSSSYEAVAHFPETPTAVALRLCNNSMDIMAPYGLQDLFECKVRPTPFYEKSSQFYTIYLERIKMKKWNDIWEGLTIEI
ncbi:nucleotidyltransferase family protein [Ornithinibacillus halotolerans]|uniref:Nucleotidyltransferase family protein n=1 Tax=Ornithinibacillus halotolerans TaxID=1274357 RepID=A0A916S6U2_9BACI|nr:nucleotidyltransferase family protein [Ornithinibacillus halotolerans]GGA87086.1 hypothetical protein GCM10008025_32410 [Ornithinibacillus halotolerans]